MSLINDALKKAAASAPRSRPTSSPRCRAAGRRPAGQGPDESMQTMILGRRRGPGPHRRLGRGHGILMTTSPRGSHRGRRSTPVPDRRHKPRPQVVVAKVEAPSISPSPGNARAARVIAPAPSQAPTPTPVAPRPGSRPPPRLPRPGAAERRRPPRRPERRHPGRRRRLPDLRRPRGGRRTARPSSTGTSTRLNDVIDKSLGLKLVKVDAGPPHLRRPPGSTYVKTF
jgi:hypothetical protein